jgi:predicted dienelactone hydrolase
VQAADAGESFRDARIKAYYIMASGPGQGFGEQSLKSISAPFVVDTAELDEILDPRANSSTLAKLISGAREITRPVGHFAYVPECRPIIGPVLARVAGVPICNDPNGVDRAAVHQQVARDVIRFFNTALPASCQISSLSGLSEPTQRHRKSRSRRRPSRCLRHRSSCTATAYCEGRRTCR